MCVMSSSIENRIQKKRETEKQAQQFMSLTYGAEGKLIVDVGERDGNGFPISSTLGWCAHSSVHYNIFINMVYNFTCWYIIVKTILSICSSISMALFSHGTSSIIHCEHS